MKELLLFLAGLLVGANVVYFLKTRECPAPATNASLETARSSPEDTAGVSPAVPAPGPATGVPSASTAMPSTTSPPSIAMATPATPEGLLLPVAGIKPEQLIDTFSQSRGTGRQHDALDIMATRGTPVLATTDGKVEKLFVSKHGGLTIYEFDPDATHAYYYAHLDRYAAGLVEGMPLKRGDVIGYVGSSGNANPDAPHLHFAIFVLGAEKRWWQGTAINPYPLLVTSR